MSKIYLKKGDQYLEVKVGFSLRGVSGNVKLKDASKEVALREASPIFDLDRDIRVLWSCYGNMMGEVAVVPVLRQGSNQAEIKTWRCNPSNLFANARHLLELRA